MSPSPSLTEPAPSARRLAGFLKRRHCIWTASPSVALLAALVAGKGRPTRILVQEGAPSFVGNISKISGAVPVSVPPEDADAGLPLLREALGDLAERSGPFWGVVAHRDGRVVGSEVFSAFASHKVPLIELCLGSLQPLARGGPSGAALTIVSLDHEPSLRGLNLTGLLTSDDALAARIRRFCLPGPETRDYVLDAAPRGLAEDEAALLGLIERAITPQEPRGLGGSLKRLFQSSPGPDASTGAAGPALPMSAGSATLLARVAEADDRLQQAQASLAETEGRLQSARGEAVALTERLARAQADGESANAQLQIAREDHNRLAKAGEEAAVSSARQEAELVAAFEGARSELSERLARAESDLAAAHTRMAEEARAKEELERTLVSGDAERATLSGNVARIEEELRAAKARLVSEAAAHAAEIEKREADFARMVADRDDAMSRVREGEDRHRDALQEAGSRLAASQRAQAAEVSGLKEALSHARKDLEAVRASAERDAAQAAAENRTVVARLQDRLAEAQAQGAAAEEARSSEAAVLSVRVEAIAREKAQSDACGDELEQENRKLRGEIERRDRARESAPSWPGAEIIDFESPEDHVESDIDETPRMTRAGLDAPAETPKEDVRPEGWLKGVTDRLRGR